MKRKITQKLETWKAQKSKKPLVLFGARQTGKTTSVLEFAKNEYENVVHIDFYKQPYLKAAFANSLEPESIIELLEALLRQDIDPATTLLFFDEIQECEEAVTSLKFFCTDAPEFNIVAAGSLLGVHVARRKSFPVGYVDMLTMHPMDFEEFCWALGENRAFNMVRTCFQTMASCAVHSRMMSLYRTYLLIGGMPEAVRQHSESASLEQVRTIQENIRTAYVADMAKYATNADTAKIIASWESLPAQLAKESGSTKFMWKHVASGANAERYATSVDWLVASGIVTKCTQISCGMSPLKSFENPGSFKLYAAYTGLLVCAYNASPSDFDGKGNRTARFRGGMAENYVMQQLAASEACAYYWGTQSTYEVEFVIKCSDGVVPIEVKSGERVKSTSAKRFAEKYNCPYIVRVTGKDFGETDQIRNVPLYAACLIAELS